LAPHLGEGGCEDSVEGGDKEREVLGAGRVGAEQGAHEGLARAPAQGREGADERNEFNEPRAQLVCVCGGGGGVIRETWGNIR
jgi:hypothetical protein